MELDREAMRACIRSAIRTGNGNDPYEIAGMALAAYEVWHHDKSLLPNIGSNSLSINCKARPAITSSRTSKVIPFPSNRRQGAGQSA